MTHGILVVEDNPLNRELLCDWLEVDGYEVWSATDLKASHESIAKRLPEVVLLDINLGAENGLDFVAWMRQKPEMREIPRDCRDGTRPSDGAGTDPTGGLDSVPVQTNPFSWASRTVAPLPPGSVRIRSSFPRVRVATERVCRI